MKHICSIATACALTLSSPALAQVPALDHVVVVVMENHSYNQVRTAPFTASLIAASSVCTQSYAITHPSFPNYLCLWAGSTLGITNNNCPAPGAPFMVANLGQACEAAGVSWRAYCEDLPEAGSAVCSSTGYQRKHAPWTYFGNLDHMNERPLGDLVPDITAGNLPRLAFIVPNQCNSTHDCPVATGDAWLESMIPTLIAAVGARGVVILTWDEDDGANQNNILTVISGPLVKPGYAHTSHTDHFDVLRTICDALGVAAMGNAATAAPIDNIWIPDTPPRRITLGRMKANFIHE